MTSVVLVASALLPMTVAGAGSVDAGPVPACVETARKSEARRPAVLAAPSVQPTRGRAGTGFVVRATGFQPGDTVTFVGLYDGDDCTIVGLGDQFLGTSTAGSDGSASLRARWPSTFDPLFGRDGPHGVPLPDGRYWIIATACADRGSCSLANGSEPGGPFVMASARASRDRWAAIGGAAAVVLGVAALRRRAHKER